MVGEDVAEVEPRKSCIILADLRQFKNQQSSNITGSQLIVSQ